MGRLALTVAALLLLSACVTAAQRTKPKCQVTKPPGVTDRRLPNILQDYPAGYKLTAEVNDVSQRHSVIYTEYYIHQLNLGFLSYTVDNATTNVFYSSSTNEAFTYTGTPTTGGACATVDLSKPSGTIGGLRVAQWTTYRGSYRVAGPSALLVFASLGYLRPGDKPPVFQGESEDVRGIRTLKWSFCLKDDDDPFDIYFANRDWDSGYGHLWRSLPVRVRQGTEYTDFFMMQPYDADIDNVFKIPRGLGCSRLYEDPRRPPTFNDIPISFHAELMFTNPTVNGKYHYISHLDIVKDPESEHFSLTYTPWDTAAAPKAQLKPEPAYQEIFDSLNHFKYRIQKGYPPCYITTQESYLPVITLPDNSSIDVLSTLLPTAEELERAVYIGRQIERGISVEMFEITKTSMLLGNAVVPRAVVNYGYLANNGARTVQLTQQNLLVLVELTTYNKDLKPYFHLAANVHHVDIRPTDLYEKLSIATCYSNKNADFSWVQVAFEASDGIEAAIETAPAVKDAFLKEFMRITRLSHLRLPRVLVDFTGSTVYFTVMVLERPQLGADYVLHANKGIVAPDWSGGVMTLEECFKVCTNRDFAQCSGVAYCGASCYATIASDPVAMGVLKDSADCNMYIKTDRARQRKMPLIAEAVEDAKKAIADGSLVLSVVTYRFLATHFVKLTAVSIEDAEGEFGSPFGISSDQRRLHRKGPDIEGFHSKLGYKHRSSAETVSSLGRYLFLDCAEICRNRPDCQSFSSCLSTQECLISTVHTPDSSQLEKGRRCAVFFKNYLDGYEIFEGLSLDITADKSSKANTVDDCARLCTTDQTINCKSFDYCSRARDENTRCRLHITHLRDFGDPSKIGAGGVEACTHYSRVFLSDFSKKVNSRAVVSKTTVVSNVTAEECAKLCREATFVCVSFDFCSGPAAKGVGTCVQHEKDSSKETATIDSPMCSFYSYVGDPDATVLQYTDVRGEKKYKKGTATGLAFLLLFVGVGLGIGAMFGYRYYNTKRASS